MVVPNGVYAREAWTLSTATCNKIHSAEMMFLSSFLWKREGIDLIITQSGRAMEFIIKMKILEKGGRTT